MLLLYGTMKYYSLNFHSCKWLHLYMQHNGMNFFSKDLSNLIYLFFLLLYFFFWNENVVKIQVNKNYIVPSEKCSTLNVWFPISVVCNVCFIKTDKLFLVVTYIKCIRFNKTDFICLHITIKRWRFLFTYRFEIIG